MNETTQETFDQLRQEIAAAPLDTPEEVEAFHIRFLSKKQGTVTELLKGIRDVEPQERRGYGQGVNALKELAEERLQAAREAIERQARARRAGPKHDLTLPGRRPFPGSTHPLTQTLEEIKGIFGRFGFAVAEGPEVEDDWHNFTALNFPPDHPARDMQDTFFLRKQGTSPQEDDVVLRTHTSPVQIRTMLATEPPVRIIAPGRVYRNEAISYKSFCLFHQVEGLYVDEGVSFADLKQVLHGFARALFGQDVRMRFRPSYFPFTEPSAEMDVWWQRPDGGGQWMEILGCGMVHPNVLRSCDVDPERYTGYAFGMGVERMAMLRYGISDIRIFYENDIRFLEQF